MATKGLTLRQRKFIKGISEGKNPHRAAIDAGYKSYGYEWDLLKNAKIQNAIEKILDKLGVTDEMLLDRLISIIKDYDASTKDRTNALQGLRLLWELKGSFPAKKVEEKLEVEDGLGELTRKDIEDLKKTLRLSLKQSEN